MRNRKIKGRLFSQIALLLLSLTSVTAWADTSENKHNDEPSSEFDQERDFTPKTETVTVEILADEELDEEVRNIPPLVRRIKTERFAAKNPYILLPHKPNYVLPYSYYRNPSNEELSAALSRYADEPINLQDGYDHPEGVFQISLKSVILQDFWGKNSRLEFAYTNRSFWQLYNQDISRPFRETNHEPELMVSWPIRGRSIELIRLSLNHQSNGQASTLSRSWNRIILEAVSIVDRNVYSLKTWYRIPEKDSADPDDPSDDDNPDILEYMGYGEFRYVRLMNEHQLEVMIRNNLDFDNNRGAIELGYSFPLNERVKGYAHYFNGYGESMIDYNRFQERIGIGIKLSDWF